MWYSLLIPVSRCWAKFRQGYFQFLVNPLKRNCGNSKTSDDIDMKFGLVTKLDKRNKTTSKKFDDYIMPKNCHVITIFPIYSQSGAIWKQDSGRIVCKTYIFINSNSLSDKN